MDIHIHTHTRTYTHTQLLKRMITEFEWSPRSKLFVRSHQENHKSRDVSYLYCLRSICTYFSKEWSLFVLLAFALKSGVGDSLVASSQGIPTPRVGCRSVVWMTSFGKTLLVIGWLPGYIEASEFLWMVSLQDFEDSWQSRSFNGVFWVLDDKNASSVGVGSSSHGEEGSVRWISSGIGVLSKRIWSIPRRDLPMGCRCST